MTDQEKQKVINMNEERSLTLTLDEIYQIYCLLYAKISEKGTKNIIKSTLNVLRADFQELEKLENLANKFYIQELKNIWGVPFK